MKFQAGHLSGRRFWFLLTGLQVFKVKQLSSGAWAVLGLGHNRLWSSWRRESFWRGRGTPRGCVLGHLRPTRGAGSRGRVVLLEDASHQPRRALERQKQRISWKQQGLQKTASEPVPFCLALVPLTRCLKSPIVQTNGVGTRPTPEPRIQARYQEKALLFLLFPPTPLSFPSFSSSLNSGIFYLKWNPL